MIRGSIKKFLIIIFMLFVNVSNSFGYEKIGIITDALLTPINAYNAYFKTPDFFAQDLREQLLRKDITVVPLDTTKELLIKSGMYQRDIEAFQSIQQGYSVDYTLLKKIAKNIGVKKIIIVTMGMDIQRDFLKNTVWNIANVPGADVVNPTHRVSVYMGLVDTNKEVVLWESIYAKNIRNNKMKNLDTTIANNYEGMLRLKEYSRYISPDAAYNIKMKLINPNFVEPPTEITKQNVKQYVQDKHNIGNKKELSEIERKKWNYGKLGRDTGTNIAKGCKAIGHGIAKGCKAIGNGVSKMFKKTPKKEPWL